MRGEFHFESSRPDRSAVRFIQLLAIELRASDAMSVTVREARLSVQSGVSRSLTPFDPLTCVASGEVWAEPTEAGVLVRFQFRMPELSIVGLNEGA